MECEGRITSAVSSSKKDCVSTGGTFRRSKESCEMHPLRLP